MSFVIDDDGRVRSADPNDGKQQASDRARLLERQLVKEQARRKGHDRALNAMLDCQTAHDAGCTCWRATLELALQGVFPADAEAEGATLGQVDAEAQERDAGAPDDEPVPSS